MTDLCFVLDSEALSRAVRRERAMTAMITKAHQAGARAVTSSMTLIEAYHSKIRRSEWNWVTSRIVVEPVTKEVADEAIALLADTGLHGHKYAIDAALAVIAGRQRGRVAVFTSDADDMRKLCGAGVQIRGL
ncbi:PIN domain-containing protein [Streptomyces sp. NBC_01217]|uniref:PIN domain-containing protein n=1 Tax=Streptomyces sp. NBC_01217 TaxID=2903779 RepID=UPI002E0EE90E|nr:PIN domain-containing protein [Streptomyces sp. NBC_01217]